MKIYYENEHLKWLLSSDGNRFFVEGRMDELFVHDKLPTPNWSDIQVDLSGLQLLNSCGVRELIYWLKKLPLESQVNFYHCPVCFISQASMVHGLVSPKRRISSFLAPYFEPASDREVLKLLTIEDLKSGRAPDFENEGLSFDGSEERYFNFLRFQTEIP